MKDIAPSFEEDKKLLRAEKDMFTLSGWTRWRRL